MVIKPYPGRGFVGVILYQPKFSINLGGFIRAAACNAVDFIGLIGARYKRQRSDTGHFSRHIPLHQYDSLEQFIKSAPQNAKIVPIENLDSVPKRMLQDFTHPERAMYVFGSENEGLPRHFVEKYGQVTIPSVYCHNVAVAGAITLYDRGVKCHS